jgi:hypothetical protein
LRKTKKVQGGKSIAIQDGITIDGHDSPSFTPGLGLSGERTILIIEIMARTKSLRSEETVWNSVLLRRPGAEMLSLFLEVIIR